MRNSDPRVKIVFVHGLDSDFHSTFTLSATKCNSNTGPILVFPRIQPFGSIELSSLGKVHSRQATESVNRAKFFSVFRHEILSDFNCSQESCISTKFTQSVLL